MIVRKNQIDELLAYNINASEHWIFSNIHEGEYLYRGLEIERNRLLEVLDDVVSYLDSFIPSNLEVFNVLFPKWKKIQEAVRVELISGAPEIYDMMVRDGIIFIDIQNLIKYLDDGYKIDELLKMLITHEFVHICINDDYPPKEHEEYIDELDYILFQEGLAHAIQYINIIDVDDHIEEFKLCCDVLKKASIELDTEKQKQYLIDANEGDFWYKYGAICSMLYILSNFEDITKIYNNGYYNFHKDILSYYEKL